MLLCGCKHCGFVFTCPFSSLWIDAINMLAKSWNKPDSTLTAHITSKPALWNRFVLVWFFYEPPFLKHPSDRPCKLISSNWAPIWFSKKELFAFLINKADRKLLLTESRQTVCYNQFLICLNWSRYSKWGKDTLKSLCYVTLILSYKVLPNLQ